MKKIIICETNECMAAMYTEVIEVFPDDLSCKIFESSEDAVEEVKKNGADIFVFNSRINKAPIDELVFSDKLEKPFFILTTGHPNYRKYLVDRQWGFVNLVIAKPFDFTVLLEAIENVAN